MTTPRRVNVHSDFLLWIKKSEYEKKYLKCAWWWKTAATCPPVSQLTDIYLFSNSSILSLKHWYKNDYMMMVNGVETYTIRFATFIISRSLTVEHLIVIVKMNQFNTDLHILCDVKWYTGFYRGRRLHNCLSSIQFSKYTWNRQKIKNLSFFINF